MEPDKTKTCSIVIEIPARTTVVQIQAIVDKLCEDRSILTAKAMIESNCKRDIFMDIRREDSQ